MTERYADYVHAATKALSTDFDDAMYQYFIDLIRLCFRLAREHESNEYAYLSDYLVLALQSIGIDKALNDIFFDADV